MKQYFDVIDRHDFVYVHKAIPQIFEGIYVDVCEVYEDGGQKYSSVRLSRPDARALAHRILRYLDE